MISHRARGKRNNVLSGGSFVCVWFLFNYF